MTKSSVATPKTRRKPTNGAPKPVPPIFQRIQEILGNDTVVHDTKVKLIAGIFGDDQTTAEKLVAAYDGHHADDRGRGQARSGAAGAMSRRIAQPSASIVAHWPEITRHLHGVATQAQHNLIRALVPLVAAAEPNKDGLVTLGEFSLGVEAVHELVEMIDCLKAGLVPSRCGPSEADS